MADGESERGSARTLSCGGVDFNPPRGCSARGCLGVPRNSHELLGSTSSGIRSVRTYQLDHNQFAFVGVYRSAYDEHKRYLLLEPFRWSRSRRIFVNSMSDLFQDGVDDDYIRRVFEVMAAADWHIYQMLTKRGKRMRELTSMLPAEIISRDHIWLGVSVEDRKYGLPRIDELRATPAKVRFLSVEPLLEDLGEIDLRGIHWVIVGGESGPGARRMDARWVLSIRDQCRAAKVPFFFKQWGGVQKSKNGRELEGKHYDEYPTIKPTVTPIAIARARREALLRDRFEVDAAE